MNHIARTNHDLLPVSNRPVHDSNQDIVARQLHFPRTPTNLWWPGEEVTERTLIRLPVGVQPGDFVVKVATIMPERSERHILLGIEGRDTEDRYHLLWKRNNAYSFSSTLAGFHTNHITAVGEHEARGFRLDDTDEGYVLEQGTWHLLEHLFGRAAYHSPQVMEGAATRELTDICGYSDVGMCFVEPPKNSLTIPAASGERRH